MNRRVGVWTAIICILVVGVSVTRTTSRFVSSQGPETAAASAVVTEETAARITENGPGAAARAGAAAGAAEKEADAAEGETDAGRKAGPLPAEGGAISAEPRSAPVLGQAELQETEAAVAEEYAMAEMEDTEKTAEEKLAEKDIAADGAEDEDAEGRLGENGPGSAAETEYSVAISPLDTTAANENAGIRLYSAEELSERLGEVQKRITQYSETVPEGPGGQYAMAEFEWTIWNDELSVISQSICQKLDEKETESFKLKEAEWRWNRTADAEKAAVKNGIQTAKEAEYMKGLAEDTKERCYQLVDDYQEVLDR